MSSKTSNQFSSLSAEVPLTLKYRGMAFLHYIMHCLTLQGVPATIPLPDSGDDLWLEIDGAVHRLQVKSSYSFTKVKTTGVRRYMVHVGEDMVSEHARTGLAVGLHFSESGCYEGQYRIGLLSSAFLKALLSADVIRVAHKAAKKKHYNIHFELYPYPHSDTVVLHGNRVAVCSDVTARFGTALGRCPGVGLLLVGPDCRTPIGNRSDILGL